MNNLILKVVVGLAAVIVAGSAIYFVVENCLTSAPMGHISGIA